MPPCDAVLSRHIDEALELVRAGEVARTATLPAVAREFYVSRLELLYEFAFLRMFVAWEVFLEDTFFRYLCGYVSRYGQATLTAGSHFRTLTAAQRAVLQNRDYVLWHNPTRVVQRSASFIRQGRHEIVIASSGARLEAMAAIRHRIAHGHPDAQAKFDGATMALAGKRYRASRPGRFLRDWCAATMPPTRWLRVLGDELRNLAIQVV